MRATRLDNQPRPCTPRTAELRATQLEVQSKLDKHRFRSLDEYAKYVLKLDDERNEDAVGAGTLGFLFERFRLGSWFESSGASASTMTALLGAAQAQAGGKAHWVDMMCGYAIAMREAARDPQIAKSVRMTAVDLVRWEDVHDAGREALEARYGAGILKQAPKLVLADATRTRLSSPADLLTSVEGIQYVDDKLAALVHWYNALAPEGVMVIATGTDFPRLFARERGGDDVFASFMQALETAGVRVAVARNDAYRGLADTRTLVVQRTPGTRLTQLAKLVATTTDADGFVTSRYDARVPIRVDLRPD